MSIEQERRGPSGRPLIPGTEVHLMTPEELAGCRDAILKARSDLAETERQLAEARATKEDRMKAAAPNDRWKITDDIATKERRLKVLEGHLASLTCFLDAQPTAPQ